MPIDWKYYLWKRIDINKLYVYKCINQSGSRDNIMELDKIHDNVVICNVAKTRLDTNLLV